MSLHLFDFLYIYIYIYIKGGGGMNFTEKDIWNEVERVRKIEVDKSHKMFPKR